MIRVLLLLTLACTSPAWAQGPDDAPCVPLSATEFQAIVDDAWDALLDDDGDKHGRLVRGLQARAICFDAPVPADAWASLLYGLALVRYAEGGAWQPLVDAALGADPALERRFGPPVVRGYEPQPSQGTHPRPEVAGVSYFLDGQPAPARFDLDGIHMLQTHDGTTWQTVWVEDGELPDSWRPATLAIDAGLEAEPAYQLRVHTSLGLAVSVGGAVSADVGDEPAAKLVLPIEAGLHADLGAGWVRGAASVAPMLTGRFVYEVEQDPKATVVSYGGHVAGGGRIDVGYVGGLVGAQVPSRALFQAVGGAELHRAGIRLEGRAGIALTTLMRVEPAFAVAVVYTPSVWRR